MTSKQEQEKVSGGGKGKRVRSPAYPAIDLPEALQKAEVIRTEEGKNATNVETALAHWGYKAKSGGGMAALSALIKFGLLEDEGKGDERRVRLTPLAMKILLDDRPESPERLATVREAALRPSIHREVWDKYQGALPSDTTLRYFLRHDRAFQDEAAEWCVQELRTTLTYARLPESANISPKAEDKVQPEGEPKMTPPETIEQSSRLAVGQATPSQKTPEQPKGSAAQTNRTMQIPLTGAPWALLQVPYPMTEENWEELERFLALVKKPMTTPSK